MGHDINTPHLVRPFTSDGTPSGVSSLTADTSGAAVDYYIEAQTGEQLLLQKMQVVVSDYGSFDSQYY